MPKDCEKSCKVHVLDPATHTCRKCGDPAPRPMAMLRESVGRGTEIFCLVCNKAEFIGERVTMDTITKIQKEFYKRHESCRKLGLKL